MPPTLSERLGYDSHQRLVILTCDGLGGAHSANVGIYRAMRSGLATSASLMVPAPWARDAAARYRGEDVGVQLTLNSEHDTYRWGPVTHSPSLLDGDGGFPRTAEDTWEHADLVEVRRECRAQVERAVYWGFDVTHITSHLDVLARRPELFDIYLELALDFHLPLRLPEAAEEHNVGFPFRALAKQEGAISADHCLSSIPGRARRTLERILDSLEPGITEVSLHPAADTPELRALDPDWAGRTDDLETLCDRSWLGTLLERAGAMPIPYRALREMARS